MKPKVSKIERLRRDFIKGKRIPSKKINDVYGLQDIYGTVKRIKASGIDLQSEIIFKKDNTRYAVYSVK